MSDMANWHESDTGEYTPLPAKVFIATRSAADAIEQWLRDECHVDDGERAREVVEDYERGWLDPMVEA